MDDFCSVFGILFLTRSATLKYSALQCFWQWIINGPCGHLMIHMDNLMIHMVYNLMIHVDKKLVGLQNQPHGWFRRFRRFSR